MTGRLSPLVTWFLIHVVRANQLVEDSISPASQPGIPGHDPDNQPGWTEWQANPLTLLGKTLFGTIYYLFLFIGRPAYVIDSFIHHHVGYVDPLRYPVEDTVMSIEWENTYAREWEVNVEDGIGTVRWFAIDNRAEDGIGIIRWFNIDDRATSSPAPVSWNHVS